MMKERSLTLGLLLLVLITSVPVYAQQSGLYHRVRATSKGPLHSLQQAVIVNEPANPNLLYAIRDIHKKPVPPEKAHMYPHRYYLVPAWELPSAKKTAAYLAAAQAAHGKFVAEKQIPPQKVEQPQKISKVNKPAALGRSAEIVFLSAPPLRLQPWTKYTIPFAVTFGNELRQVGAAIRVSPFDKATQKPTSRILKAFQKEAGVLQLETLESGYASVEVVAPDGVARSMLSVEVMPDLPSAAPYIRMIVAGLVICLMSVVLTAWLIMYQPVVQRRWPFIKHRDTRGHSYS